MDMKFTLSALELDVTLVRLAKEIQELRSEVGAAMQGTVAKHLDNLTREIAQNALRVQVVTDEIRKELEANGYSLYTPGSTNPKLRLEPWQERSAEQLYDRLGVLKKDLVSVSQDMLDLLACVTGIRTRDDALLEYTAASESVGEIAAQLDEALWSGKPIPVGEVLDWTDKFLDFYVDALK